MSVDQKALESTIRGMYPEIIKHSLSFSLNFDTDTDSWIVTLSKGKHKLTTHLEKKDAEACLDGIQCIYLGVQIGQFVKNFEQDE
jgi:trehalose utilization protein